MSLPQASPRCSNDKEEKCYNGTMLKCTNATHDSETPLTDKISSKPAFHHDHAAKATTPTRAYCATEQWSTESGNTTYGNVAGSLSCTVQAPIQDKTIPRPLLCKQTKQQAGARHRPSSPAGGLFRPCSLYLTPRQSQDNLIAIAIGGNDLQHAPAHAVLAADQLSSEK